MLHHVALEVRREDAEAEVAFWVLLGFEEVAPPPTLAGRARWVEREGTQIHLLFAGSPVVPPAGHAAVVGDPERLRAAGHAVEERARHWGVPRWVASSPSGHRVEVMSAPPDRAA